MGRVLLPFNHIPVTCPKREAEAACPHALYPREGAGDALVQGRADLDLELWGQLNPAG